MKYFIIITSLARYRTLWQDYFHAPIHYEAETKFCMSFCKSDYAHVHVQTMRLTSSKFGGDTGEEF